MNAKQNSGRHSFASSKFGSRNRIAIGFLALLLCLATPAFVSAQNQQDQQSQDQQSQNAQAQDQTAQGSQTPDSQTKDQQSQPGDTASQPSSTDATPQSPAAPPADAQPSQPTDAQPSQPPAAATPGASQPAPQAQPPQPQARQPQWHYSPGPQAPAAQNAPQTAPQGVPPNAPPPAAANVPGYQVPAPQGPGPQATVPQGPAAQAPVPQVLSLPAGTVISVRALQWLSSNQNNAGDRFTAELDQPIVVNGWVVARRGQSVLGRVVLAQKSGHGNNESKLGVDLAEITLVDGERIPVSTQLFQDARMRSQGRDAATVGGTTALGALFGAAIGGGQGAVIGAAAGIGAGMAAVLATPGRPTIIHPEQLLTFRLQAPVDIDTTKGHVAFRPVTQADYGRENANRPLLRYPGPYGAQYGPAAAYPPAPYYYSGYCGGPWRCYPGPGPYYYGPGYGPGFYVGGVWR